MGEKMKTYPLLEENLKSLRLATFLKDYNKVAEEETRLNHSYQEYLSILAEKEVLKRQENATHNRIKQAHFPAIKTLDIFDFSYSPSIKKREILEMMEGKFVENREDVIFVGPCGTGKTHLAIAIGVNACHLGYKVFFTTTASLINTLLEAKKEYRLNRKWESFSKISLIILDELGYIPFDKEGTDLLFQFVSQRYEQASLIITTNLAFADWGKVFHDTNTTAAILDRLVHHSIIINITGKSYRLQSRLGKEEKKKEKKQESKEEN